MKRAVLAVDPVNFTNPWTERVFLMVRHFQDHGLFTQLDIVPVIHPNLYLLPFSESRNLQSKEGRTIAHTINEYTESEGAWLIVLIPSNGGRIQKRLLGSTARRTVALSKLPFLSLKAGDNR